MNEVMYEITDGVLGMFKLSFVTCRLRRWALDVPAAPSSPRRRSHKKLFVDTVSETVWNTTWKPEQTRDMMTDVQQDGCLEERETV